MVYSNSNGLKFILCTDCRLIWRSPESMEFHSHYSKNYVDSKNYLRNRSHKINKANWLLKIALYHQPQIRSLLEIGSSVGSTLEAARNLGFDHLGIDINDYAVSYCQNAGLHSRNITLDVLIVERQRFDIIFMQHVLEHFPNPFEVLSTCRELLNTGGLLEILVPNANYGPAARKREKHRFYSTKGVGPEHYVYFNYATLSRMLKLLGFKIIQKNYPLCVPGLFRIMPCLNKLFRRVLSIFHHDQEILIIAQKT